MGQSSNDIIPSVIHISAYLGAMEHLCPSLRALHDAIKVRAEETMDIVKTGRTHLMDAMPVRMGSVMAGWADQIDEARQRIEETLPRLGRLAIGGTAVGTGINAHPEFARRAAEDLSHRTGYTFSETTNHFSAQSSMDAATSLSGQLKTLASSMIKIADDLRWMNSGPIAGLGEISLPALQPGSSIMPGKVNPVVCEAVMMAGVQVIANDLAVTIANSRGNFELNVMLPLIARNLLESIMLLANSARELKERAIKGFTVNHERVSALTGKNPILVTALNPVIGYDKAAQIAKKAYAECRPVLDVAHEMTGIPRDELERILDPRKMA